MKELTLPLTGGDNRCIRDALGNVVSIPEHAQAFAHAMNCHKAMLEGLRACVFPLEVLKGHTRPDSTAERNAISALQTVRDLIVFAESQKLPPAPTEATVDDLTDLMGGILDQDVGVGDFAREIVKKYKVFPR